MGAIKKIGVDIRNGWKRLDETKKKRMVFLVLFIVVILLGLTYFTQRKNYTVLFSNLDEAEAGSIVEHLEADGMDYQLKEDGSTILIDESEVDRYRIDLAVDGLMPGSSIGFDLFDETGMMTTDDDRAIMYQRAVQDELENAIRSLSLIEDAQVLLDLPEESIFQNPEYQTQSSASVRINTTGALTQQSVQGIASLVAGAVANLPMQNINIIDDQGALLSGFLQEGENGQVNYSSNNQSIRRAYEEDMEQRILKLLGTDARVSVYANMDFEAVEGERVTYENPMSEEEATGEDDPLNDPEQERRGLLRSESVSGRGGGDYSSLIDVENQTEVDDEEGDESDPAIDATRNYELNQETERFSRLPGEIDPSAGDVTATIIVDEGIMDPNDVREIAARALGIRTNPDADAPVNLANIIEVQEMSLSDAPEDEGRTLIPDGSLFARIIDSLRAHWLYAVAFGTVLLIGLILLIVFMRKRKEEDEMEDFGSLPQNNEQKQTAEFSPESLSQEEQAAERKRAKKEQENKVLDEREEKAKATARENPELAVELLKLWLNDTQNN